MGVHVMCVCVHVCGGVCLCVYMCMRVMCVCVHVCESVSVRGRECVCVCVCMCLGAKTKRCMQAVFPCSHVTAISTLRYAPLAPLSLVISPYAAVHIICTLLWRHTVL